MANSVQINDSSKSAFLKKWPLYVLLLPVFFVLHGVRENFGFILPGDYLPLVLFYCSSATVIFGMVYLLYRQKIKTGILTFLILSVFFFYGFIQDFLNQHFAFINRYIILVPLFFSLLVLISVVLKRCKSNLIKANFFFNCLLLIYTLYDLSAIIIKTISPPADKFSVYPFAQNKGYKPCNDCPKPDIYFLIFDEYASSLNLKNNFDYDNSQLDNFLIGKQFHIQKNSSANYNFTPFSISSILNMSYISGISTDKISGDDYASCNKLIRENAVIKYLSSAGYDIINYSIFDIAGNPSPVTQDFLPLKARLITDRTFWGRAKKDIDFNRFPWLSESMEFKYKQNNNKLIGLVKKESSRQSNTPRFVYAHYNMPHPPYYFDKNGNETPKEKLGHQYDADKNLYLGNVAYCNLKIKELVNTILKNSQNKAVIVLMGDHGFRYDKSMPQHVFFQNQNAVYIPDNNYNFFYDNISGVNQFRVLINTLFKQDIPLLRDSTIFLRDK